MRKPLPTPEQPGPTGAMRVRDMPWEQVRAWLRAHGPEIGQLALRGDKTAIEVRAKYQHAFEHPSDQRANFEVRVAIEDYINRELRLSELKDLGSKFGHREEEQLNPDKVLPLPRRVQ